MGASHLDRIVAEQSSILEERKRRVPLALLKERIAQQKPPLDFAAALRGDEVSLVAEIKKASPSGGLFRQDFDPVALACEYAAAGVAALSVVTEERYFQGHLDNLATIRERVSLPLLRKDFLFDPYQIYEARAYGADAVLLIAAIHDAPRSEMLFNLTRELGMQPLIEVHHAAELSMVLSLHPQLVGINHRDLRTFQVDLENTRRLRPRIPEGILVMSESGIRHREDVERVAEAGADAVLVGEALVRSEDPRRKARQLMGVRKWSKSRSAASPA